MNFRTYAALESRMMVCASVMTLAVLPAAQAEELRAPVLSKKKVAPGESQTLNPQPIPPGKVARNSGVTKNRAAPRAVGPGIGRKNSASSVSRSGADKSIIFVGGKKRRNPNEPSRASQR